eukprot:TRINITY_DN1247_c0_g1_i1.p1 TRINITY_DN1247_c0_g1~~TRINITY_DN1247_c0_g1_i1.p1  ORF type:complete len:478 (+),score=145.80 TRINITY_DN1247_c0_g1_i1:111-1544(+)
MITNSKRSLMDNDEILPHAWSMVDVLKWLDSIYLPSYKKIFEKKKVNGEQLLSFDKKKLKEIGIKKTKHQNKFLDEQKILLKKINERSSLESRSSSDSSSSSEGLKDIIESLSDLSLNYKRIMKEKIDKEYIRVSLCLDQKVKKINVKRRYSLDQVLSRIMKKYGENEITLTNKGKVIKKDKEWKKMCDNREKISVNVEKKNSLKPNETIDLNEKREIESEKNIQKKPIFTAFQVIDSINRSVAVLNDEGIIIYHNNFFGSMFSYNDGELIGESNNILLYNKNTIDNCLNTFIKTGDKEIFEECKTISCITKMGKIIKANVEVSETSDDNERCFFVTFNKHENAPREEGILEQSREMIENLMVASVLLDQEGNIQGLNNTFTETLGYELHDLVGEELSSFICNKTNGFNAGSSPNESSSFLKHFVSCHHDDTSGNLVKIKGVNVLTKDRDGKLKSLSISLSERRGSDSQKVYVAIFL